MSCCTWINCESEAKYPQIAEDGDVWANLCDTHNQELDSSLDSTNPKILLSVWVKAQGGAKRAAQRTLGQRGEQGDGN